MPEGVEYVNSWVSKDGNVCCQINKSQSEQLLHQWASNRENVTDFEFIPVITSEEMNRKTAEEEQTAKLILRLLLTYKKSRQSQKRLPRIL